jgi:hypothetical protein
VDRDGFDVERSGGARNAMAISPRLATSSRVIA